jgi:hypothetical protein
VSAYEPLPRAIAIAARTAHLIAMAGYLGGRLAHGGQTPGRWRLATTVTGGVLLATEATHSRHWPYQGRGVLVLAHVGILPLGHVAGRAGTPVAVAALVIGAVGSHLPRSIRKWSLRHRRVVPDEWRAGHRASGRPIDQVDARGRERGNHGRAHDQAELAD